MSNNLENTTVCVMGLGYVGLPTAGILAGKGYRVLGVDTARGVVRKINAGATHIHEPGLSEIIRDRVAAGRLSAHEKPRPAHVFIIAVPTPINPDKSPDISYVENAVRMIAPHLRPGNLVIIESTCPVGTTERAAHILHTLRPDLPIPQYTKETTDRPAGCVSLCYCPERVLPGNVFTEFVNNNRLAGGMDPQSADLAKRFYRTVVRGKIFTTDCRTAEMAKLAENTYRDVNIAYANELALLARGHGVDAHELIALANQHPRVNIHNPGAGVGGHCIPVDPWFLIHGEKNTAQLIKAARVRNDSMPAIAAKLITSACRGLSAPCIALLGLAYKADTDDLRESPAIKAAQLLAANSEFTILAVEPYIKKRPAALAGLINVQLARSIPAAIKKAHVVAVLTPHAQFLDINPALLESKHAVIDMTGILNKPPRAD
jgi:UDP-N-acetyl-D-mannosaminuronic acid dehydrogenase